MNDRGIIVSYLLSPLSKNTNLGNTSHFRLVKASNSNTVNDLLLYNAIPITLYNDLLTFRDTGEECEMKGDLFKMITNKSYNVDLASLSDKNLLYDFAKELYFDVKAPSEKSTRGRILINLPKLPAILASGVSTIFLPVYSYKL